MIPIGWRVRKLPNGAWHYLDSAAHASSIGQHAQGAIVERVYGEADVLALQHLLEQAAEIIEHMNDRGDKRPEVVAAMERMRAFLRG